MSYEMISISEAQLDRIRTELGAVVDRIRGKSEEGKDIDTVEITKSAACEDLTGSSEAATTLGGTSTARVDLLFDHAEVGPVRLRVSTRNGSVWFVNDVPEVVMDEVLDVIYRVTTP
jgi:hypothetical protein